MDPADRKLRRDGAVGPGSPLPRSGIRCRHQFQRLPVKVREGDDFLIETRPGAFERDAVVGQSLAPVPQRRRGDRERHGARLPGAFPSVLSSRPGEKREVGAGAPDGVSIEEVIGARIVLIHRAFNQPEAQHTHIEVHVLLRVSRNRRDVVNAL